MKDIFKSNKFVIFIIILLLLVSLVAATFAFFTPLITEGSIFSTTGNANADTPDFTFTELSGAINLTGTYPMTDEAGLKTEPYSFKIKNNETADTIKYEVVLETNSSNTLPDYLVSTSLGGVLTSNNTTRATQTGYSKAYVISSGSLVATQEQTFNLKIWINEDGTVNNAQNKTWTGKIVVRATFKEITESEKTLAALGLTTSVQVPPTNYNMFDYTYNGYYRDFYTGATLNAELPTTTEGVYPMDDDFGTSYYFRGSKSLNNIVEFGTYNENIYTYAEWFYDESMDMSWTTGYTLTGTMEDCKNSVGHSNGFMDCSTDATLAISSGESIYWRIVRINGDGTLRLMYIGNTPTATGGSTYLKKISYSDPSTNPSLYGMEYTGYTYDNSAANVQDGTPSKLKTYLENWYTKNLVDEDTYIATGQYFNDTSGYEYSEPITLSSPNTIGMDVYMFAPTKRLEKNTFGNASIVSPILKTIPTTKLYGGVYNLKIGLINVDEVVLSGMDGLFGASDYDSSGTLYPYTVNTYNSYWTMSPGLENYISVPTTTVYVVSQYGNIRDYRIEYEDEGYAPAVIPVINLTAEAAQSLIGTGSTTDYYHLPE